MTITLLIAHLLGIYLLILGILFAMKPAAFVRLFARAMHNYWLIYISAGIELVLGVAIVLTYTSWAIGYEIVMAILGIVMIAEAAAYLFLPYSFTRGAVRRMNRNNTFIIAGAALMVLGIYLMYVSGVAV